ncbi:sensitivity to red-light reduced protein [Basidiobolus ranarum]|uniref:Sensitivity to red-light reduced protein n=1 Tax=Basidiobolus ranarum TaxID=34480 RepID=A0ABR2WYX2_9FUNG
MVVCVSSHHASPVPVDTAFKLPEGSSERACSSQGGLRVLIVDDNHIYLNIVSRMLKKYFTHVVKYTHATSSPLSALEALSLHLYDLILLDIDMPVLTGIEATQEIRNPYSKFHVLESNRRIPIIAVTTNDLEEHRRHYTEVGMNACVGKPVSLDELRRALNAVIGLTD